MTENTDKLPKWAQLKIARLERDYKDACNRLAQMDEQGKTNVKWSTGLMDEHNLPQNSQIVFIVDGERIDVSIRDNELRVSGQHKIIVAPSASNSVYIRSIR